MDKTQKANDPDHDDQSNSLADIHRNLPRFLLGFEEH